MKNDFDLYLNYLKNELYFCQTAIKNIDKSALNNNGDVLMVFYHASVLFNSLSNISKILNNLTSEERIIRSENLKELLDINSEKIKILRNREYRNSNEHYDERIDLLLKNRNRSCFYIDFSVFDFVNIADFDNFGRIYITSERAFYFTNSKINTEKIYLSDIESAVSYIDKQLQERYTKIESW